MCDFKKKVSEGRKYKSCLRVNILLWMKNVVRPDQTIMVLIVSEWKDG